MIFNCVSGWYLIQAVDILTILYEYVCTIFGNLINGQ